ncbi:MAG: response regulator [Chloroflexota bacterium]|nr:MAG: response regulator [Chloroflexota bacterium]
MDNMPTSNPKRMPKILLVEDDPLLSQMYQTKFRLAGFGVLSAADGEEGLELLRLEDPDMLILDQVMQKMTGIELLRQWHKQKRYREIPVLMLSNLSHPEETEQARQLGVKEFIIKAHHTPTQIVQRMKEYLPKSLTLLH